MLLVAVVLTMMLSVGTALAHKSDNHKVCYRGDTTISGFTHKQQQRFLDRHPKANPGKCDNDGGGKNIPQLIAKKTTAPWR